MLRVKGVLASEVWVTINQDTSITSHNTVNLAMINGFGGLGVACWPLVPKFAGSNPAEAVGFLGGEVKPSVPCRKFVACKRSLNLRGSWNLGKITTGHLSRPQFHLSLLGSLASLRTQAPGG